MNLEIINKWLHEEYGCSYTRLEELHDFYFEKYCDLQQENKQLKKVIDMVSTRLEYFLIGNTSVIYAKATYDLSFNKFLKNSKKSF